MAKMGTTSYQQNKSIKHQAEKLDKALETLDTRNIIDCFAPDCEIELLGVLLRGHAGVKRWVRWMQNQGITNLKFSPRTIVVQENIFIEEFDVTIRLKDGSMLKSKQTEVLEYKNNLVASLRLYFNPIDLVEVKGALAKLLASRVRAYVIQGLLG